MERLAIWRKVRAEELVNVEDPFFAVSQVRDNMLGRRDLSGIKEFMEANGLLSHRAPTADAMRAALKRVEEGEWLLVKDKPISSVDVKRYGYVRMCMEEGKAQCLDAPGISGQGPGKWRTISISAKKGVSALALAGNLLASLADEGRVFLSDGKDFANTVRVIAQRWVPLGGDELSFARSSAVHQYGEVREILQHYVEFDDQWDITGRSWHWRPVVANEVYEFKEG